MNVTEEQLDKLQSLLLTEYGVKLSDSELETEALRLTEFAKTILRFKLTEK